MCQPRLPRDTYAILQFGITGRKCHEEDEFLTILMIEADWVISMKMLCIVPLTALLEVTCSTPKNISKISTNWSLP